MQREKAFNQYQCTNSSLFDVCRPGRQLFALELAVETGQYLLPIKRPAFHIELLGTFKLKRIAGCSHLSFLENEYTKQQKKSVAVATNEPCGSGCETIQWCYRKGSLIFR